MSFGSKLSADEEAKVTRRRVIIVFDIVPRVVQKGGNEGDLDPRERIR